MRWKRLIANAKFGLRPERQNDRAVQQWVGTDKARRQRNDGTLPLNPVLYGHGTDPLTHLLLSLVAATVVASACSLSNERESMPEVQHTKSGPEGPCGGDTAASFQTFPFLLPDQPELGDACLRAAVPGTGGSVEIGFDLRASGSVKAVHIPATVKPSSRACLEAWALALEFSPPHDCKGRWVEATTSIEVGFIDGSKP